MYMTKDEILALDPIRDYNLVLEALKDIGISVRPLSCNKCRHDHYLMLLEELNLLSEVDLVPRGAYIWDGIKVNKNSNQYLINEFCSTHPRLCKRNTNNLKKN